MEKQRIDFIDLAKGLCIIQVVFVHIHGYFNIPYELDNVLCSFRMPLYFFLSGLFFKTYNNLLDFTLRKINKLLIPFLFFFLTTSILLPHILYILGYSVRTSNAIGWQSLYSFITPERFPNEPIWFLLCLFITNIFFYSLHIVSKRIKYPVFFLIASSVIISILGYYLGYKNINLPMYIDTAMTSLIFFCTGYIFYRHSKILYPNKSDKYIFLLIIISFAYVYFVARHKVNYITNIYNGASYFEIVSCGIVGTLFVILFSKCFKRIKFISYWGRYSIIILCTHNLIIQTLIPIIKKTNLHNWYVIFATLTITMFLYLIIIPFCIRFLPHVTAQKDLIKIKD